MHHNLDIHPIPEKTLYVSELDLLNSDSYATKAEYDQALTGKTVSQGGILPEDNVRIYIPMDLNADAIMHQLNLLYLMLESPSEHNETWFFSGVQALISQLEIYDQVWVARDAAHTIQKTEGGKLHSSQGIQLARKMVNYLSEDEGSAECFPFEIIDELREEYLDYEEQ